MNSFQKISNALPANFESLNAVQKLEALHETAMEVLGIQENLILVNGDLTVSEFLGPALSNQKLIALLSQQQQQEQSG